MADRDTQDVTRLFWRALVDEHACVHKDCGVEANRLLEAKKACTHRGSGERGAARVDGG
jgi:hypothetical protein